MVRLLLFAVLKDSNHVFNDTQHASCRFPLYPLTNVIVHTLERYFSFFPLI
jgi:hypothetical protein